MPRSPFVVFGLLVLLAPQFGLADTTGRAQRSDGNEKACLRQAMMDALKLTPFLETSLDEARAVTHPSVDASRSVAGIDIGGKEFTVEAEDFRISTEGKQVECEVRNGKVYAPGVAKSVYQFGNLQSRDARLGQSKECLAVAAQHALLLTPFRELSIDPASVEPLMASFGEGKNFKVFRGTDVSERQYQGVFLHEAIPADAKSCKVQHVAISDMKGKPVFDLETWNKGASETATPAASASASQAK